jgi:hypothetical protein
VTSETFETSTPVISKPETLPHATRGGRTFGLVWLESQIHPGRRRASTVENPGGGVGGGAGSVMRQHGAAAL